MKHVCVKKCFYRSRLWKVGEILSSSEGDDVPEHFVSKEKYQGKEEPKEKPVALSQYKEEKVDFLDAVKSKVKSKSKKKESKKKEDK